MTDPAQKAALDAQKAAEQAAHVHPTGVAPAPSQPGPTTTTTTTTHTTTTTSASHDAADGVSKAAKDAGHAIEDATKKATNKLF